MDKKNIYNNYNSTNFFPETYILNYTSLRYYEEEIKFLNKDETNPYQIWISKPVAASQGKGNHYNLYPPSNLIILKMYLGI